MRFAEVAVDAPTGYDRTFSYSLPSSLDVATGHLVKVPFGQRKLQGVVFSIEPQPQVPETREILAITDSELLISDTQLSLARWVSRYYMCSLFDAVSPMLPPGAHIRAKTLLSLSPDIDDVEDLSLTPLQQRVVGYVRSQKVVEQGRLVSLFGEGVRSSIRSLLTKRIIVSSSRLTHPKVGPRFRDYVRVARGSHQTIEDWMAEDGLRAPRRSAMLSRLLKDDAPLFLTDIRKEYGAGAVKLLLDKGWIEKESIPVDRDPLASKTFPSSAPATLTPRQETVASEIRATLENVSDAPRTFLVQGVTGSGKTEVYLDAVNHCLKLGKKAIVLVPEIALTHQTIERFAARFPGRIAVLHSGLSTGERFDQWWKVKRGDYDVVIGSRSAVFAPQADLGLIIIDEEHEWTYKQQDASPRYHTRDVALRLAELTGAAVVLGSASPDVTSYYKGLRKEFRLFLLPGRVTSSGNGSSPGILRDVPLASVKLVDMRRELREGNRGIFSRALTSAMSQCLDDGGQMMLFLNRRGSASYMQCRNCGHSLRCRRCDVAMTYHKRLERLVCHYCGYRRKAPDKCPECLSYRMSFYGVGTQTVVEELNTQFPGATVLRWDRDAARNPKSYEEILNRFRSGDAQILVGTQMIAKGLHFPSVTLVGVVSADLGLNIPDYRSGERVFQLLCQVAGRAGRGSSPGKVVIQTYQPENYAVQAAASQDYQRFYSKEMAYRREQANPPYSKLIRLLYSHTNRALCEREALRLTGLIRQQQDAWGYSDIELLGPTPAYPPRLRGHYRWHLVLRGPEPRVLLERVTVPQGWAVDIDPVSLT